MRRPRFDVPGVPMHATHRGVDRAPVFRDDIDRQAYLLALGEALRGCGVALHGYVLMGNHVHLVATPAEAGGVSRLMQSLGRRFVRRFNDRHGRTGTLWEGRFHSFPVDSDRYLLNCLAYVELNPVRAGMVQAPEHYPWSSVHQHLGLRHEPWLTPHPTFLAIAGDAVARARVWRGVLRDALAPELIAVLRDHARSEMPWGSAGFLEDLARRTGRRVESRRPGRPRTSA